MPRPRLTHKQRQYVIERAQGCCEYCLCQAQFATQSFSIEHIIPLEADGNNEIANLALACQGCNAHKHTKQLAPDPLEGGLVPLYHPRQQYWHEHFGWNEDYTVIVGLTPTGRATVVALRMNRPSVVNLRRLLYAYGEHPPLYTQL